MSVKKSYIDLFAGCGGLSTGLLSANWAGLFAVEKNADAFCTLKYNLIDKKKHFNWPSWLPEKEWDINELLKNYQPQLLELREKVTLVAGGPPCQGFSMAGKRNKDDQRNKLVKSYIKFIKIVLPEAIIFENVHGFTINFHDAKGTQRYSSYVERALKKLGYRTEHRIVDISNYGVPQKRRRFILIAMRHHAPSDVFTKLELNKAAFCEAKGIRCSTSILEAISDLEYSCGALTSPDTKGFKAGVYGSIQSDYQRLMRNEASQEGAVDSHRFVKHREKIIQLHTELLKTAPVGKRITPADNLIPDLYRRGVTVLDASSQAPTITSIPDELVHYKEPRILTVRELARIQSFPDWFEFKGKYTSGGQRRKHEVPRYTQVGNAVPPLFAEQIGTALLEVLSNGERE